MFLFSYIPCLDDVHQLKTEIREVKAELKEHGERIAILETNVNTIDKRLAVA